MLTTIQQSYRLRALLLGVGLGVALWRDRPAYGQAQPAATPTPAPNRWQPVFGAAGRSGALLAQGDRLVVYGPTGFILSNDGGIPPQLTSDFGHHRGVPHFSTL